VSSGLRGRRRVIARGRQQERTARNIHGGGGGGVGQDPRGVSRPGGRPTHTRARAENSGSDEPAIPRSKDAALARAQGSATPRRRPVSSAGWSRSAQRVGSRCGPIHTSGEYRTCLSHRSLWPHLHAHTAHRPPRAQPLRHQWTSRQPRLTGQEGPRRPQRKPTRLQNAKRDKGAQPASEARAIPGRRSRALPVQTEQGAAAVRACGSRGPSGGSCSSGAPRLGGVLACDARQRPARRRKAQIGSEWEEQKCWRACAAAGWRQARGRRWREEGGGQRELRSRPCGKARAGRASRGGARFARW
jgi:hypothetical protein